MPPKPKKKAEKAPPPNSMGALLTNLQKRYGERVVRRDAVIHYEVISTGSLTLDLALRVGGWVLGRMHELVGPEGVGKTTLMISTMVEAQKKFPGYAVGYIDMEQTFDYAWAEANGLDTSPERFVHMQPDDSEDVADMLAQMAETQLFRFIAIDSIGAMESREAFEKDAFEKVMGRNAQVITRMVKRCAVLCRRNKVAVVMVNQYRANLSGLGSDISAGPKAMKYSTTTKVEMAYTGEETIKYRIPGDKDDSVIGRMARARVTRNKVAVQGKSAEFYIINYDTPEYGPVGIDRADEAITVGVATEVIRQAGAWYYVPTESNKAGESRFQGREKVAQHLRSSPDDLELVRVKAIATMAGDVREETETTFEHETATA